MSQTNRYPTLLKRLSMKDKSRLSEKMIRNAIHTWEHDDTSSSQQQQYENEEILKSELNKQTIFEWMDAIPTSKFTDGYFRTSYDGCEPELYLWIIDFLLTQRPSFDMNKPIFMVQYETIKIEINCTPLCLLAMNYAMSEKNILECVKMITRLIQKGVDVNKKLQRGINALFMSALPQMNNDMEDNHVLRCLLRNGANINIKDDNDNNVLFEASHGLCDITDDDMFQNFMKRFHLLVQHGAQVQHKNKLGNTLLMMMLPFSYEECDAYVKKLVRLGVNINDVNKNGDTALMMACYRHNIQGMKVLLENGANKYQKNKKGMDVFDHVLENYKKSRKTHWDSKNAIENLKTLGYFSELRKKLTLMRHASREKYKHMQQQARRHDLTCPISLCLMEVPVRTRTGSLYNLKSIHQWLRQYQTDPMTNLELQDKTVLLDQNKLRQVRNLVDRFLEQAVQEKQRRAESQQRQTMGHQDIVSKRSRLDVFS